MNNETTPVVLPSSSGGVMTPPELMDLLGGITIQGVYKALRAHQVSTELTSTRRRIIHPAGIRKLLEERGFSFPKQNISFQIVKGGTGKTSLSFALALRASHYGARVLAIDFDQQGNMTRSFNLDARDRPVWVNIFRDGVKAEDAIVKVTDGLHVIPSNLNNARLDTEMVTTATNLKDHINDKLSAVRDNYDLVIMDCPPAINKINTAAACSSDLVIVPINPDPYAMDGLEFTLNDIERLRRDFKINPDVRIVWNRYDARERLGIVYMHELAKAVEKADKILPVVIRTDAAVKNAVFDSRSIFDMPKKSTIREDIDQFTREVLGINEWKEAKQKAVA